MSWLNDWTHWAIVGGIAVAWVLFVVTFRPFQRGQHAAPHGGAPAPVTRDVHHETVPVAVVAGFPPWGMWQDDLAELPDWAAPEAARRSSYGWNSGSGGSDYGGGFLTAPPIDPGPGASLGFTGPAKPGGGEWRPKLASRPPVSQPGQGDATPAGSPGAYGPQREPLPGQSSEIAWTAPLGDEPRSVEQGASGGRGLASTDATAPVSADWLGQQLALTFDWVRWMVPQVTGWSAGA